MTARASAGVVVAWVTACALACSPSQPLGRELVPPGAVAGVKRADSPYLKAHMRDGRLYVLATWSVNGGAGTVAGHGRLLDLDRRAGPEGDYQIPLAEVAIFETNRPPTSPVIAALAVTTVGSLAGTALCLANPKACFGSCPTFYVSDGERPVLSAEGFSDSVAPSLEATDVDALFRAHPEGRALTVRMTNEALETHVVDAVDVLAVPRPPGGRAFHAEDQDGGGFYGATALAAPASCEAPEGPCADSVRALDGREWSSPADGQDLGAREQLTLTFPAASAAGPRGLVIAARETLLTTYLLYQTLAYLGSGVGDALTALERDPGKADALRAVYRRLGDLEVEVEQADGRWTRAGSVFETGPIATDVHLVRLPPVPAGAPAGRPLRVRLNVTRGNWRLDWIALATLGPRVEATRLAPRTVAGVVDTAEGRRPVTVRPGQRIVTLPGDAYTFSYELPEHPERYELFLASRGYYLEWMREAWLREESPARAALLMAAPGLALRLLAPAYKQQEAGMDRLFWESRYAHP
ncbi:MAG TPA: hypothetical protein VKZ18_19315 [Polyangia bacterium]|nr:hypothetical protein [Polyangia bacterium]